MAMALKRLIRIVLGALLLTGLLSTGSVSHAATTPPDPIVGPGASTPDDAAELLVAVRHRIPTLNGISGGTPADWDLLSVYDARYRERVAAWARLNGLAGGLCMLTLPDGTWTPWSPA